MHRFSNYAMRQFLLSAIFLTKKMISSFVLLSLPVLILAQTGGNPLDLTNRSNSAPITPNFEKQNTTSAKSETTIPNKNTGSNNPFDVEKGGTPSAGGSENNLNPKASISNATPTAEEPVKPLFTPSKPVSGSEVPQSFLFWTVLIMLLLLTTLLTLSRSLVSRIYQAFFNDNVLTALHREQSAITNLVYGLLYAMFVVNAGVFVFLLLRHYKILLDGSAWLTLLYALLGIAAIFVGKFLVVRFIANVFPMQKEMRLYGFTILIFGIVLGIALVPLNIAIAYAAPSSTYNCILTAYMVIGLVYIFRSLRSLFIAREYLLYHKFHFLLYLCTIELAPLVVLVKILS